MNIAFAHPPNPCPRAVHAVPRVTPRRLRARHALPTLRRTRPRSLRLSAAASPSDEDRAAAAAAAPSSRNSDTAESYLQCVECAAVYVVEPEELEGAPRVVGCSACLHEWYASEADLLWGEEEALSALAAHASFEAKSKTVKSEGERAINAAKGVGTAMKKDVPAPAMTAKTAEKNKPGGEKDGAPEAAVLSKDPTRDSPGENRSSTSKQEADKEGHFNVFVGNLSFRATEEDLYRAFSGYGAVLRCQVPADQSGASRGYGFVEMRTRESALKAIESLQGTSIMGRDVSLNEARPRKEGFVAKKQQSRTGWSSRARSNSRDFASRASGDGRTSPQSGFRKDRKQQKEGTKDRLKYSKNS